MTRAHVLVIDDDPDMRDVVSQALESFDFEVSTASNGADGLAMLERRLPDLILLDMRMPAMDGWTFASELHRRYGEQVPVVVCTAAEDTARRAREVGAVDALGKPFELDDLLRLAETHARPHAGSPDGQPLH